MRQRLWIDVSNAREGLDLVEALTRRGLRATLVAGPAGCKVRVVPTRDHSRAGVPREAA